MKCTKWRLNDSTAHGYGRYDRSLSMLLGAQINLPQFNSTGAWHAFGPWERARGAILFPSPFDPRAVASKFHAGSSAFMDHLVAYVEGGTSYNLSLGGP